jgi:Holliday junction resolvase RusA-like endonuclease
VDQGLLEVVRPLVLGPVFLLLELPGVPPHKARHRSRIVFPKDGRKPFVHEYPDPATEKHEKAIAQLARILMRHRAPTELPVAVAVEAFKPVPQSWTRREREDALAGLILPTTKPDWDNHGKITDALKGIVWKDDSQVVDGHVYKRYSAYPRLVIEVREYVAP